MINNSFSQRWQRLGNKNLQQSLIQALVEGLNCSPFEARAVLDTVHQIYAPYLSEDESLGLGQIKWLCLGIENPPGRSIDQSSTVVVRLTIDAAEEDLAIRQNYGVAELRRHRMQRMAHQAYQQGGLLTIEDLAYRLLNCGQRTLARDLQVLKNRGVMLPLRSTIKDMGRGISHRSLIVRLWLEGQEYSEIASQTYHSVASVANYINKFKRCVLLAKEGYDSHTVAHLVGLSPKLASHYWQLYDQQAISEPRRQELVRLSGANDDPDRNIKKK